MKIGLDARWIFREISGIGLYTRELIRHLAHVDRENDYVLFFNCAELRDRTIREAGLAEAANFKTHLLPFGLFSPFSQLRLPGIIKRLGLDVFHSTNYMIPLRALGRARCVVTMHDLIPLVFPEYTPRAWKSRLFFIYRRLMRAVAARADLILTVSQSSRNDVIRHLHAPPERVLAVYEGVTPSFRPPVAPVSGARNEKKILWVGRADPYKNLVGLIEAFGALRGQLHEPAQLRLIGAEDARYPDARRRAEELRLNDALVWRGYLSDARLIAEYQAADLFVLPSRYEGFGLPVLEAMACGTPVVCSDKGSLPEIAAPAAIIVPPDDVPGLTEAMRRVLSDMPLAQDMRAKGLLQAAKFTWEATARATLQAYRKVCQ
jgi:glycosyltransferase involved in cell wall biosynthesis